MRGADGIWRRPLPLREYRWRCGHRSGLWHRTYDGAGEAAVRAGLATWEGKRLFLGPLVEIEARDVPPRRIKKAGQA